MLRVCEAAAFVSSIPPKKLLLTSTTLHARLATDCQVDAGGLSARTGSPATPQAGRTGPLGPVGRLERP